MFGHLGPTPVEAAQTRPNPDQFRQKLGKHRSNSAEFGPNSLKADRVRVEFGRKQWIWAEFGPTDAQIQAELRPTSPKCAQDGPNLGRVPNRLEFYQLWPEPHRIWPAFDMFDQRRSGIDLISTDLARNQTSLTIDHH